MKEKLTAIHNQALRILAEVGIKLHHADLLDYAYSVVVHRDDYGHV
jgi:trimethylamine:corrinoid methyltransferase-like protein